MAITSPPYYRMRRYTDSEYEIGAPGQCLGHYIKSLVDVFTEVRRVLRPDGTFLLNIGDTYADKALLGVPWQVAFALRDHGWILRSDSIWSKPNGMPDAARDRPEHQHEHLFLFAKSIRPYWDKYAVPRADRMSVRPVPVARSKCKHFASYPVPLIMPYVRQGTGDFGCCSRCGTPWVRRVEKTRTPTRPGRDNTVDPTGLAKRDRRRHVTTVRTIGWAPGCRCTADDPRPAVVLDPFAGICTTALACEWSGRDSVMCDVGHEYLLMGRRRLATERPPAPGKAARAAASDHSPLPGQMEFPAFSPPAGQPVISSYV